MSALRDSPAHPSARRARDAIDDGVRAFRIVPLAFDRAAVADRLQRAIQLLYVSLDTGPFAPAHQDSLDEAMRILDESLTIAARAGSDASLDAALAHLANARAFVASGSDAVSELILAQRGGQAHAVSRVLPPVRPFRASTGLPELHALSRAAIAHRPSLDPIVSLTVERPPPKTMARPKTIEELRAFGAAIASGGLAPPSEPAPTSSAPKEEPAPISLHALAIDDGEAQRRVARDCLEDVASLSILRRPIPTESYLDQGPFEQRMLDAIDAFASFGGVVLPMVSLYHAEAEVPDPTRAFACALVLGCIEGSDVIDTAVGTLREAPPEEHPGFIEGLVLAPSPEIDAAMIALLEDREPALVAVAIEVLMHRRTLPNGIAHELANRRDRTITLAVARALGSCDARDYAVWLLTALAVPEADDELFIAAVTSLLLRGHGGARDLLRTEVDSGSSGETRSREAAFLLCLAGRPEDLDALLQHAWKAPSVAIARGLGRFGHIESLSTLIQLLAHENPAIVEAAAESLDRITAAGLRAVVEVPWDVGRAADPHLLEAPTRSVEQPIIDPARWESHRAQTASKLDPRTKWRGGRPFRPVAIVDELEAISTPPSRRPEAALELAIATGVTTRFATWDWVARQKSALEILRDDAQRVSAEAGAWCFAGAGSRARR